MQVILLGETVSMKSKIVYNDNNLGLAQKRSRLSGTAKWRTELCTKRDGLTYNSRKCEV